MTDEAEPKNEFMHRPGELFIASGEIHVLAQVGTGFTPADTECEEYEAVCGTESQSWSMPAQNIPGAEFIASLKDGKEKGAKKCLGCFQSPEEIKFPEDQLALDMISVRKAETFHPKFQNTVGRCCK